LSPLLGSASWNKPLRLAGSLGGGGLLLLLGLWLEQGLLDGNSSPPVYRLPLLGDGG